MKTEKLRLLYLPCGSLADAKRIGRILVEEKLAACVNIVPRVHSIFREKQRVKSVVEALLLAKVPKQKQTAVTRRIQALHSYDVPCICFYEAESVNPDYLNWVHESLR